MELNCLNVDFFLCCSEDEDGWILVSPLTTCRRKTKESQQLSAFVIRKGRKNTILLWMVDGFLASLIHTIICRACSAFASRALLCIYLVTQIHTWDLLNANRCSPQWSLCTICQSYSVNEQVLIFYSVLQWKPHLSPLLPVMVRTMGAQFKALTAITNENSKKCPQKAKCKELSSCERKENRYFCQEMQQVSTWQQLWQQHYVLWL